MTLLIGCESERLALSVSFDIHRVSGPVLPVATTFVIYISIFSFSLAGHSHGVLPHSCVFSHLRRVLSIATCRSSGSC